MEQYPINKNVEDASLENVIQAVKYLITQTENKIKHFAVANSAPQTLIDTHRSTGNPIPLDNNYLPRLPD